MGEKDSRNDNLTATAGDGERLIFYTAARALRENQDLENAAAALRVLLRVSPLIGGTRDICTIIVEFVDAELRNLQATEESLSHRAATALQHFFRTRDCALKILCQLAADLLDEDLDIVRSEKPKELPSTLHMFIPHRDRGSKWKNEQTSVGPGRGGRGRGRGGGRGHGIVSSTLLFNRKLANTVAEILIWSKTSRMNDSEKFASMYQNLLAASSNGNKNAIKKNLYAMQTIIRKHRQELNQFARERGQMLHDQMVLNPSQVTLSQIKRGKTGDIAILTKLAKKKENTRILRLINLRFSDPSKATKFGSVFELISSWEQEPGDSSDELERLQRDIFVAKTRATASYLRSVIKKTEKSLLVASLDNSQANNVSAALLSIALSSASIGGGALELTDCKVPRLLIGGAFKDISSFDSFLALLDEIVSETSKNQVDAPSFMSENIATTKAVLNLIDRHLKKDSEALLLFSSGNITMPSDVMEDLTAKHCTIHCHDSDIIGDRLKREGAKKGDITVSLAWNTFDDLDLHVHLPSGEHISYRNTKSSDGLCNLDVDMNAGGKDSNEPVENIFAGDLDRKIEAPHGKYKVVVQNYDYHGSPRGSIIPFRVIIEKNGTKESFTGQCTGEGEASNTVVTEFQYDGRTLPFPLFEQQKTAFGTSNMVNLTATTGQTLDSLGQLVQTLFKIEHLDQVRRLVNEEEEEEPSNDMSVDEPSSSRSLTADHGTLEVTSRDLLRMNLAKLPLIVHEILGNEFGHGGPTLAEQCAKQLSIRMVAEKIPLSELKRNGYPCDVIDLVKENMATTTTAW